MCASVHVHLSARKNVWMKAHQQASLHGAEEGTGAEGRRGEWLKGLFNLISVLSQSIIYESHKHTVTYFLYNFFNTLVQHHQEENERKSHFRTNEEVRQRVMFFRKCFETQL